jgi:hypothetical protein
MRLGPVALRDFRFSLREHDTEHGTWRGIDATQDVQAIAVRAHDQRLFDVRASSAIPSFVSNF